MTCPETPTSVAGVWKVKAAMLIPMSPTSRIAKAFEDVGIKAPGKITEYWQAMPR